jgi:hypothetical protein
LLNFISYEDTKTGCTIIYGEYDFIEAAEVFEANICVRSAPVLRADIAE